MGTYYINKLKIEGIGHEVELAKRSIRGKAEDGSDCEIDLSKIVPEPAFELVELDEGIKDCLRNLAEPSQPRNLPTLTDTQFDTLVTGLRNYRKTGFFASFYWRIAYWGTPWNAIPCRIKGKDADAIYFITKTLPPGNAIENLSRRLSNLNFSYTYYPETMDEIGQIKIVNGLVTSNILLTAPDDEDDASSLFEEF